VTENTRLIKPLIDGDYPEISHGKGVYLYDVHGKRYLDGSAGAVTASIGHGVQEVLDAMAEQAGKVAFVYRSHFTSRAAEELCERLAELSPGDVNWTFLVNSGSEATETAMKVAIQYWQEAGRPQKSRVLSRWMSYHGITMGALSMSGHVLRRRRFVSQLDDLPVARTPYPYRSPYAGTPQEQAERYADELETAIARLGAENVAAFIAEPIVGATGGAVVPPDGYFQRIREICDKHEVLLIADEVMTGIARTGRMFAMEHWGVAPDMITLGKGIGAGYTPIAATMVSERVIDVIRRGSGSIMGGHTLSANPLSAATALAVLDYVQKNDLVERSARLGQVLSDKLKAVAETSAIVGDVRGLGLMIGIEFVQDKATKQPFELATNITGKIIRKAFNNGLLIYPAQGGLDGQAGDAVIISPPLTIDEAQIDELVESFARSLRELERELLGAERSVGAAVV
jgi:adenosylmethionine-8-amino-7-oxononanoate aminotransferase